VKFGEGFPFLPGERSKEGVVPFARSSSDFCVKMKCFGAFLTLF